MPERIPRSLKAGHEALRATLKRAMREPDPLGAAARRLASIADGHFLREEKHVMPLLGLLPALARGDTSSDAAEAAKIAVGLKEEIAGMVSDHRQMSDAVRELARAAEAAGLAEYVAFAEELIMHDHVEEEVLYPAALVAGRHVQKLRGS